MAERDRIANGRDVEADERDRIADERDVEADERDRIADERDAQADRRERIADCRDVDVSERDEGLRERQDAVGESERAVNERAARLDQRDRELRRRQDQLDERERVTEQNELTEEVSRSAEALRHPATVSGSSILLVDRGASLREVTAELAERLAMEAEQFATYLERAMRRGDRQRRLALCELELEVAKIERRNAARLRLGDRRFEPLEHLPKLSRASSVPKSPPAVGAPRTPH